MKDFKLKIIEVIEDAGFTMDSKIPDHDITFEEITDYYAKANGGYDHKLIEEIQLYKYHNMDISGVFKGRAEKIDKYKERYAPIEKIEERTPRARTRSSNKRKM